MPFPRPDNMTEVVAEVWLLISDAVSRTRDVGARTVGSMLSSITDFICERYSRRNTPRYLEVVQILVDYKRIHAIRTTWGVRDSRMLWFYFHRAF